MMPRPLSLLRSWNAERVYELGGAFGRKVIALFTRVLGAPRVAVWAVEAGKDPGDTAIRTVEELTPFRDIEPAHIAGAYLEGYFLMGRSGKRPAAKFHHYDERAVIDAASARVPKRVQTYLRRTDLSIDSSAPLLPVIEACAERAESWVVQPVVDAWLKAEAAGLAVTWTGSRNGEIVAGMWGISLGRTFGIASMFHREAGAGAVVMAALLQQLGPRWDLIDCGGLSPHFERFGAQLIPIAEFRARILADVLAIPSHVDDPDVAERA